MAFFNTWQQTCESVWPANASVLKFNLRPLVLPFGQSLIHNASDATIIVSCSLLAQRLADFQRKIDRRPLESTNNKTMEEFKVSRQCFVLVIRPTEVLLVDDWLLPFTISMTKKQFVIS